MVRLNKLVMKKRDSEELKQNTMKRTLGLVLLAVIAFAGSAYAVDVRVTDSAGIEVLVKEISIDYGGLLGSDKDSEGVRVSVGDANVTTRWADIQSLAVTGRNDQNGGLIVEIVLKDGKTKVTAQLQRKGRMKLSGKADLGEYSIDLEKVKRITVVAVKRERSFNASPTR